jgi:hypothetical protein
MPPFVTNIQIPNFVAAALVEFAFVAAVGTHAVLTREVLVASVATVDFDLRSAVVDFEFGIAFVADYYRDKDPSPG